MKAESTMRIETERLIITELAMDMAESLHLNSLDEDNRRFVPDEVFETVQEAAETISYLMECYQTGEGPQVYAVTLLDGTLIGYVQAVPLGEEGWEIGYHIGKAYTRRGYATEAVRAFLPVLMAQIGIQSMIGVCLADNAASAKVMERCGFVKQFEGEANYQGEPRRVCRFLYTL